MSGRCLLAGKPALEDVILRHLGKGGWGRGVRPGAHSAALVCDAMLSPGGHCTSGLWLLGHLGAALCGRNPAGLPASPGILKRLREGRVGVGRWRSEAAGASTCAHFIIEQTRKQPHSRLGQARCRASGPGTPSTLHSSDLGPAPRWLPLLARTLRTPQSSACMSVSSHARPASRWGAGSLLPSARPPQGATGAHGAEYTSSLLLTPGTVILNRACPDAQLAPGQASHPGPGSGPWALSAPSTLLQEPQGKPGRAVTLHS